MKNEISGLLRELTATHRVAGMPNVRVGALARHVGVHRRTLYKVMDGGPCSDVLAGRLLRALGQIHRGQLVFEQQPAGPWQARTIKPGEVSPAPRVHRFTLSLTASGPRLRLVRLP